MTSASRGQLAVVGCCLVAALGYAGAVRVPALLTYVLPSLVVVSLVAMQLRRWVGAAAAVTLSSPLALLLAQVANATAGETSGPVARSTFLAGLFTGAAVVAAASASPALVCLPVALVLGGALYLGAAGEVLPVLAGTVFLLVLTVPLLEGAKRKSDGSVRRRWLTPLLALVVGASALTAAQLQVDRVRETPVELAKEQVDRSIIAPLSRAVPPPPGQPRPAPQSAAPTAQPTRPTPATPFSASRPGGRLPMLLGLLSGVLVTLVLVRLVLVNLAWRRLRRRLRRGSPERSVTAAWLWAVLRLRSYGVPIPASLSPDAVAGDTSRLPVTEAIGAPLRETARWAQQAVFAEQPNMTKDSVSRAWAAASRLTTTQRQELRTGQRLLVALRMPPVLQRDDSAGGRGRPVGAHWALPRFRRFRPA